jgi:hypothetical protein
VHKSGFTKSLLREILFEFKEDKFLLLKSPKPKVLRPKSQVEKRQDYLRHCNYAIGIWSFKFGLRDFKAS